MKISALSVERLESLLQSQWPVFIDKTTLLRVVLEEVRNANYEKVYQEVLPNSSLRLSITKFMTNGSFTPDQMFEIWVEFTVPKENGAVIGTHTYSIFRDGSLSLKESFGRLLLPKN